MEEATGMVVNLHGSCNHHTSTTYYGFDLYSHCPPNGGYVFTLHSAPEDMTKSRNFWWGPLETFLNTSDTAHEKKSELRRFIGKYFMVQEDSVSPTKSSSGSSKRHKKYTSCLQTPSLLFHPSTCDMACTTTSVYIKHSCMKYYMYTFYICITYSYICLIFFLILSKPRFTRGTRIHKRTDKFYVDTFTILHKTPFGIVPVVLLGCGCTEMRLS